MNWTNIKKWAKDKGYKVDREKSGDEANPYNYEWHLVDNPERKGTINSLSKLAMNIYNDILIELKNCKNYNSKKKLICF